MSDATEDRSGTDVICTRSFYKQFVSCGSGINKVGPGNFLFCCNVCLTEFEQKSSITPPDKVDIIDKRVDSIAQSMNEMKSMINMLVNNNTSPPANNLPAQNSALSATQNLSYASAAALPPPAPLRKRTVLIADPPSTPDPSVSTTVNQIIKDNGIHVDKSYVNKNGKTVYVCPTDSDCNKLNSTLSTSIPHMKLHKPPDKLPTISVANLEENFTDPDPHFTGPDRFLPLVDAVYHSHPDIKSLADAGETLSVIMIKKQKKSPEDNPKFQPTIRVSNSIRQRIEDYGNRLYISHYSCRVYDQFHVKRCNNCQKFGHYKEDCTATSPICGHCSQDHHSDSCPEKSKEKFVPCCTNCANSSNDSSKHTHTTFDRSCPAYISEQSSLRKSIRFNTSKN